MTNTGKFCQQTAITKGIKSFALKTFPFVPSVSNNGRRSTVQYLQQYRFMFI